MRGICSRTFDVADGSCELNASSSPPESCHDCVEAAEGPAADQQGAPEQSQLAAEDKGAEDVLTGEPSSPDVEESRRAVSREGVNMDLEEEDGEVKGQADVTQDTHDDPEVCVQEEKGEKGDQQQGEGTDPDPGDPSERGSLLSSPVPFAAQTEVDKCQEMGEEDGDEEVENPDDEDKIEGKETDDSEKLIYTETTKEEDNPDAEPDPSIKPNTTEILMNKENDACVWEHESKPLRYLKVPQASFITLLKF